MTAQRPGVSFADVIENIDIGGPSMDFAPPPENFDDVAIVTSVSDYAILTEELAANSGALSRATRWRLAKQAFATTAAYDSGIASALETITEPTGPANFSSAELPSTLRIVDPLAQILRYGENPHQRAALYTDGSGKGIAAGKQLQGKELSYNNIVDLDACWELVSEFADSPEAAVATLSNTHQPLRSLHRPPCVLDAYRRALGVRPHLCDSAESSASIRRSTLPPPKRSPSSSSKPSSPPPSPPRPSPASPPKRTYASSRSTPPKPRAS